jgi:hypothetical protein
VGGDVAFFGEVVEVILDVVVHRGVVKPPRTRRNTPNDQSKEALNPPFMVSLRPLRPLW